MTKPIYIHQTAINHPLGKTVEDIVSWYNQIGELPLQDARELYPTFEPGISVLKNNNNFRFSLHELKKMDTFTAYALDAMEDIDLSIYMKDSIGLYMGTCLGGIEFAERELRVLYKEGGPRRVSPYFCISMFYSSNVAQISIFHKITGRSYVFSEGTCSGFSAVIHAIYDLFNNNIKVAICGASEMPITRLGLRAYKDAGLINGRNSFLSDGAGLIVLSSDNIADKRDTEISSFGRGKYWPECLEESLKQALDQCLRGADVPAKGIDLVVPAENDYNNHTLTEIKFFRRELPSASQIRLNSLLGNSFSTAPVQKLIIVDQIMRNQEYYIQFFGGTLPSRPIRTAIVSCVDFTGNCILILLKYGK